MKYAKEEKCFFTTNKAYTHLKRLHYISDFQLRHLHKFTNMLRASVKFNIKIKNVKTSDLYLRKSDSELIDAIKYLINM